MPYGWINAAPIREVEKAEIMGIAATLRVKIAAWGAGSQGWAQTRPYHANVTGADGVLFNVENMIEGADLNYVYEYGGLVVGMLLMQRDGYVEDLIAHPGTEGCGATLLEYAVNVSQQHGEAGRLRLDSLNGNSSGFYRRMGFVHSGPPDPQTGGGKMTLDPATRTDLWQHSNAGWQLIANVGKRFAGETG